MGLEAANARCRRVIVAAADAERQTGAGAKQRVSTAMSRVKK